MSSLTLLRATPEFRRRRERLARERSVEAWRDVFLPDFFWVGDAVKAALDAEGTPLPAEARVSEDAVPILCDAAEAGDAASLPAATSLRARTLAGHGIAVAWVGPLRDGIRLPQEPTGLEDAFFCLMRVGGSPNHLWRLFRSRADAADYLARARPVDAGAAAWSAALPHEDYAALLRHFNPDTSLAGPADAWR